ncbi:MAG: endolytic transglycosylase MltG [Lachnospiraceae bacterium]|nr:endolytic transglycosylase MltG [Lachnospiraceae bacterium]
MNIKDVVLAVCETVLKIVAIGVVVVMIYRGAIIAYDYGYRIFEEEPMASEEDARQVVVVIPEGMSAKEMGELLFMKGLIRDEKLFQIQYLLSEFKEDLLPGEFTLNTAMTVEEMLEAMTIEPVEEVQE